MGWGSSRVRWKGVSDMSDTVSDWAHQGSSKSEKPSQEDLKPVFMVSSLLFANRVTNKDGFFTLVVMKSASSLELLHDTSVAGRKDTANKST